MTYWSCALALTTLFALSSATWHQNPRNIYSWHLKNLVIVMDINPDKLANETAAKLEKHDYHKFGWANPDWGKLAEYAVWVEDARWDKDKHHDRKKYLNHHYEIHTAKTYTLNRPAVLTMRFEDLHLGVCQGNTTYYMYIVHHTGQHLDERNRGMKQDLTVDEPLWDIVQHLRITCINAPIHMNPKSEYCFGKMESIGFTVSTPDGNARRYHCDQVSLRGTSVLYHIERGA